MSHPARDYVVYACGLCGKRIFTERAHVGARGACPCCGGRHTVGGDPVVSAEEGVERRRAPRVPAHGARVAVEPGRTGSGAHARTDGGVLDAGSLFELGDLSETGLSFRLAGAPDKRQLAGVRSPVAVGDEIGLTLHTREMFRPRTYRVAVRRVEREQQEFRIGVEFLGLTPEQAAELRALVRRLGR